MLLLGGGTLGIQVSCSCHSVKVLSAFMLEGKGEKGTEKILKEGKVHKERVKVLRAQYLLS